MNSSTSNPYELAVRCDPIGGPALTDTAPRDGNIQCMLPGPDGLTVGSCRRFTLDRPRNQSPGHDCDTRKIRTDDVVCLRFGKQYEIVQIETIKPIKQTSKSGVTIRLGHTHNELATVLAAKILTQTQDDTYNGCRLHLSRFDIG